MTAPAPITVSAPGSIMITGEHAVVYGHPAIVCAVEQRIFLRLSPLPDDQVRITSEIADPVSTTLDRLTPKGPMRFVLAALAVFRARLSHGIAVDITSEINPTLGLGSSAAVTAACLAGLNHITRSNLPLARLHLHALSIIRQIQGRGSGADLAASLMGGMLAYQLPAPLLTGTPDPAGETAHITPLPLPPQFSLRYCGYKTPTATVLARVAQNMQGNEPEFSALYDQMGISAKSAITAAQTQNWAALAGALTLYQKLMQDLGVSDDTLDALISGAAGADAAKISGSGLGDCVLAMGAVPEGFTPVTVPKKGVMIHE